MRSGLSLHLRRWLGTGISYALPAGSILLAVAGPSGLGVFGFIAALATYLLQPRVAGWMWAVLAPHGHCQACGHAMPLVARWKCSCGYLPPRPRHVFSRCRLCGKGFRWVVCPVCDGSSLL